MEVASLGLKVDGIESIDRAHKALESLVKSSGGAGRATDSLTDSLKKESKAAQDAGDSTADFAAIAKNAGHIIGAAFSVNALARYADAWSDMTSLVRVNIGAQEDAADVMSRLSAIARGTYSSMQATANSFATNAFTLNALGKSTQEQLGYTEALNNALVVSGAKGQQFEMVQNALNRAMSQGALRGEELQTVLNSGSRVAELLAGELGTSVLELRALAAQGRLTGEVIFNALTKNMETVRDEAASMPATISDAFTLINNSILQVVGSFDQQAGISERVAETLIIVADNMRGIASVLAGATAGWVAYNAAVHGTSIAISAATVAQRLFNAAAMTNPYILAASAITAAATALWGMRDSTIEVGDVTTRVGDYVVVVWDRIKSSGQSATDFLVSAWDGIGDRAVAVFSYISEKSNWLWSAIVNTAHRDINSVIGFIASVGDTTAIVTTAIYDNFRNSFERTTNLARSFGEGLKNVFSGDLSFSGFRDILRKQVAEPSISLSKQVASAWRQNMGRDWLGDAAKGVKDFANEIQAGAVALAKKRAELKKASDATDDYSDSLGNSNDLLGKEGELIKASTQARDDYLKWQRENEALFESVMTAQEKYNDALADLDTRLARGGISTETYRRAVEKLDEELAGVADTSATVFQGMSEYAIQAARNIQTAFADYLYNPFERGLKGMLTSFANILRRMAAEVTAARIGQSLGLGSLLGGASGTAMASGGGASMMDMANVAGFASNIFSSGFGATGALGTAVSSLGQTFGSSAVSAFGAGMTGSAIGPVASGGTYSAMLGGAGSMGATFAAVAGPAIALAAVDQIGRLIAGNKTTSTFADSIPVIGGFAGALFGRGPMRQRATTLEGTVGSGGFDDASLRTDFRAKGGLFRSNKNDFVSIDEQGNITTDNSKLSEFAEGMSRIARDLISLFDDTATTVSGSLRDIAGNLNLSTEGLDSFNHQLRLVSENGQMLTDEQIAEEIAEISNSLANSLMPGLDQFAQRGETALQTITRINSEFGVLTDLGAALGNSLAGTREFLLGTSIDQRSSFVSAAGGLDALATKAQFFADNFLTDSERLQPSMEMLRSEMGKLGLSADMSREQFRDLVQSFGHVGGISQDLLQSLLNIAPLFVRVKDGLAALNPALDESAHAANVLALAERRIIDGRSALMTAYQRESSELQRLADRFGSLSLSLRSASDQLSLSDLSPLTPQQRLAEAREQFERDRAGALAGDVEAQSRLADSGRAFLQASQIFNASSSEFVTDFNTVKRALETAAVTADTESDIARRQLAQIESSVSRLIDINNNVMSVESAIRELIAATLQGPGNMAISDEAIRQFISRPGRTTQEVIDAATRHGVSGSQISGALNVGGDVISQATGGLSLSDKAISDFFWANTNNPKAIYDTAKQYGISLSRVAEAAGYPLSEIEAWAKSNNLPMFERGTDFVSRGGLAVLHPAEAVTPANHMRDMADEIRSLKDTVSGLLRELSSKTGAVVGAVVESSKTGAKMIIESNQDLAKSASWREQARSVMR